LKVSVLTSLLDYYLSPFLLPPLNFMLMCLLGWGLLGSRKRLGKTLIVAGFVGLWLCSTPIVAGWMLNSLKPPWAPLNGKEADAIVILSAGLIPDTLEYGGPAMKPLTLVRLRYGVYLAKKFGKPILVTGGNPSNSNVSEASLMRRSLEEDYGITPAWTEDASKTTHDNALFSARILKRAGIHRIYLVSNAWHLARAIPEFERQGLQVVPAGIGYYHGEDNMFNYLPNAKALMDSYYAWHEWIGLVWYKLRDRISG
jgi:uncharacterized SAM-binding protein YcdF (DUF218 family)